MQIEVVVVGALGTNCYILSKDNKCLVIDPGAEALKILDKIGDREALAILITHRHFDHVLGLDELNSHLNVPIYDNSNVLRKMEIGPFTFETIETKGHKDDSITYYFKDDKAMFVGDFIFKNSIGRTDLETGSYDEMQKSIQTIKQYDDDIKVYPGHGPMTSLKDEKENNPYF